MHRLRIDAIRMELLVSVEAQSLTQASSTPPLHPPLQIFGAFL